MNLQTINSKYHTLLNENNNNKTKRIFQEMAKEKGYFSSAQRLS